MSGLLLHSIAEGVAKAISDIRQRVVEEGWFGRTVTPDVTTQENETVVVVRQSLDIPEWDGTATSTEYPAGLSPEFSNKDIAL